MDMIRKVSLLTLLVLLIVASSSLSARPASESIASASNTFGMDLYQEIDARESGNFCFSPYSIFSALSMTAEGARGETEAVMRRVMSLSEDRETTRTEFYSVNADLLGEYRSETIGVANGLWVQDDFPVRPDFLTLTDRYFDASVSGLDFINHAGEATSEINRWVSEKTEDLIPSIVSEGDFNENTRMVLGNAIYLKAEWSEEFESNNWQTDDFVLEDGEVIPVTKIASQRHFDYYGDADWNIVKVPYMGGSLSMVFILPREGNPGTLKPVDESLVRFWMNSVRSELVQVTVPVFDVETRLALSDILIALGMADPFSSNADFSGLYIPEDGKRLAIDTVLHQSKLEIDRYGTEAAASTVVGIGVTSIMPPNNDIVPEEDLIIFHADHPFMFLVRDEVSGAILFAGRISEPDPIR